MKKHKGKLKVLGLVLLQAVLLYGTYRITWGFAFYKGMAINTFNAGYDVAKQEYINAQSS